MSSQEEEVDLRALNLKDDEASTQGTLVVRYLVWKLQEAKSNPTLAPMVQALMHSTNLLPRRNQIDAPNQVVESSRKGGRSPKDFDKEEHSSKVAPRRRRVPHSPNRA